MNNFYKGGRGLAFSLSEDEARFRNEKTPDLRTTQVQPKNDLRITQQRAKVGPSLTQETANSDTRSVRLMYRECTVSVRGVYRKGTGDLLRSYWRSTTDLLNACTSGVDQRYNKSRRVVGAMTNKSMPFVLALICFMLFNLSDAWTQSAVPRAVEGQTEIKALQVGDTIPEEIWNSTVNMQYSDGRTYSLRLDELRDKMILIDFWASWCASCIEGFPKMQKIQKQFGAEIAVLLVNSAQNKDTEKRVNQLFARYSADHGYELDIPYLLQDSIFEKLFPHNTIPHIVWINKEGVLVANSYPSALTSKNIQTVLAHGNARIHQKTPLIENKKDPMPLIDTTGILAGSFFKPYQEGYKANSGKIYKEHNRTIYQVLNMSISRALSTIYHDVLHDLPWRQWIFENQDDKDWKQSVLLNNGYDKIFCYQAIYPDLIDRKKISKRFKEDFENAFAINVSRKSVEQEVYVVKLNDDIKEIETAGGIRQAIVDGGEEPVIFQNIRLDFLINHLSVYFDRPLVIDDNRNIRIDISIPFDFNRYPLQDKLAFLCMHGLELDVENRKIEIAYIAKATEGRGGEL